MKDQHVYMPWYAQGSERKRLSMAEKVRQNKISLETKLVSPVSYSCKFGNTNSKKYMHPNVHSGIIYNCQDMETA